MRVNSKNVGKFSEKFLFMQINAIIFHKILHISKKNCNFAAKL